jgi:membrane-associated phospholipid phosphatase
MNSHSPLFSPWRLLIGLAFLLVLICIGQSHLSQKTIFELTMQGLQFIPLSGWWSITRLGETLFALALCTPWFWRQPRLILAWGLAAAIGGLLSVSLKEGFNVMRPAMVMNLRHLPHLGPWLYYNSFPSGHTITAFASVGVVLMRSYLKPTGTQPVAINWLEIGLGLVLASLVGLSRIALGAHWPLDVLAGACVGGIAASLGIIGVLALYDPIRRQMMPHFLK